MNHSINVAFFQGIATTNDRSETFREIHVYKKPQTWRVY